MMTIRTISITFFVVLISYIVRAQNDHNIESVNSLRQNGKIYVVVLVLVTVLMGVLYYLTLLDRKQKKIEQNLKK